MFTDWYRATDQGQHYSVSEKEVTGIMARGIIYFCNAIHVEGYAGGLLGPQSHISCIMSKTISVGFAEKKISLFSRKLIINHCTV